MVDGQVEFLDEEGLRLRHLDADIGEPAEATGVLSGEANDVQPLCLGGDGGVEHVAAIAGSGDAQEHIAGRAVAVDLLCKDELGLAVVHEGGGEGRMGGEGDGGEGSLQVLGQCGAHLGVNGFHGLGLGGKDLALELEFLHQFANDVLAVGGRAAVAANEELAACGEGALQQVVGLADVVAARLEPGYPLQ